ncbi:MAG: cupin domain-containing protein [Miltoncostaeaceae bacterium]
MTRLGALLALPAAMIPPRARGGAGGGGEGGSPPTTGAPTAAEVDAAADAIPLTTTLNGTRPPGRVSLVSASAEELVLDRDGQQVRVYRDVRPAGTRAPIHVHGAGGWTCVVKGQAIMFVEGAKPSRAGVGECVNMPPLTPMSNYNPGPGPATLLDSFVTPPGAAVWRIVEDGYTDLGNEFAHGYHPSRQGASAP